MKNSMIVTAFATAAGVLIGCTSSPNPKPEVKVTAQAPAKISPGIATADAQINVTELATQVHLTPYPNEKKREGVLIEELEAGTAWTRMGFEKGDVIARVGEKSLASNDASVDLFRAVGNPGSEKIEVLRKGKGKSRQRMYLPLDPK